MLVKYVKADITLSENHVQQVTVPEWELPVLTAMWDRAEPVIVEELLVTRELPDAADEFTRLTTRYRTVVNDDGSQGAPWVAAVYGSFQAGVSKLAAAIKAAVVPDPVAVEEVVETGNSIEDLLGGPVSSVGG